MQNYMFNDKKQKVNCQLYNIINYEKMSFM